MWLKFSDTTVVQLSHVTAVHRVREGIDGKEAIRVESPAVFSGLYPSTLIQFRKFLHLMHEEDQWVHCSNCSIRLSAIHAVKDGRLLYCGCDKERTPLIRTATLPARYCRSSGALTKEGIRLLERAGNIVSIVDLIGHSESLYEAE